MNQIFLGGWSAPAWPKMLLFRLLPQFYSLMLPSFEKPVKAPAKERTQGRTTTTREQGLGNLRILVHLTLV